MAQQAIELILMRQLAAYLAMPIILVDQDGALLFYNEPAGVLLGRRFDEEDEAPLEQRVRAFQARDEGGRMLEPGDLPIVAALRERRPVHRPVWITGHDGVERKIEVTAFPIEGQGGRHLGAVSIFWGAGP